jgi:hypothetical protein
VQGEWAAAKRVGSLDGVTAFIEVVMKDRDDPFYTRRADRLTPSSDW